MALEFTAEVIVTCPHCKHEFETEADVSYEPDY
jgi:hypothetical protein